MHKILIFTIIFLGVIPTYAQDLTLDFCVGTWKYENQETGEEFTITLRKAQNRIPQPLGGGTEDCIAGVYIHKKNGVTLTNCMNQLWDNKDGVFFPIFIRSRNDNWLYISICDYNKKNGWGEEKIIGFPSKLYLYATAPKKLKMVLEIDAQEEIYLEEKDVYPRGTSLPNNIILTQIE